MMDLDHFKQINDNYGHLAGDAALVATAHLLSSTMVGRHGILARYGGDEFIAMLVLPDEGAAMAYTASLQKLFEAYNRENHAPYRLNISVGCARYRGGSFESFVETADRELYRNKRKKA